jgi:hypothetical protein
MSQSAPRLRDFLRSYAGIDRHLKKCPRESEPRDIGEYFFLRILIKVARRALEGEDMGYRLRMSAIASI